MKRLILIATVLFLAGGAFWSQRRQLDRALEERERVRVDLQRRAANTAQAQAETSTLESKLAALEQALRLRQDQAASETEALRRTAATNAFGPPGGIPTWSSNEGFVWMEKRRLPTLNVAAFRSTDSAEGTEAPGVAQLLNRLWRQMVEAHPEFAHLSSLPPDQAAAAMAEYTRLLADTAAGLDGPQRRALEAAARQAESAPRPGAMTQPPAEYHLNNDAAVLLEMTATERGTVERTTTDMLQRFHQMEQRQVSMTDNPPGQAADSRQSTASFKVAAFPEEGGALRKEWIAQLTAVLGSDRTDYLLQMSANWIRSDLGDFGEAERTLTIRESAGSGGFTEKSSKGHYNSVGTGGPAPIPAGWRHLIARPAAGGLPSLRTAE